MSKLLVLALFVSSCSTAFFGATRTSSYVYMFDREVECAFVEGWTTDSKPACMCRLTDLTFSEDKTFVKMMDDVCTGKIK